jgi:uncharacterized membrane protein YkvA (DUF1232 family)
MTDDRRGYEKDYSEEGFWDKLFRYAGSAGREVVAMALELYYAAQSPGTPTWAKAVIYGALGYFISLIDAIPDLTPIVGYTDDLGVLAAAMAAVMVNVTPEVRAKAAAKLRDWFGEN